jgi:hypothetical protein
MPEKECLMQRTITIILAVFLTSVGVIAQGHEREVITTGDIRHSIPLEGIIFDDFDNMSNRALLYTDATPLDKERLQDRIRPICHGEIAECLPVQYEPAEDVVWMGDDFMVIGYLAQNGQAYAYPFHILNRHEIVNDTIADNPILVSYCPLCRSAIIYSRMVDEDELIFGNTSALYESDMVMYDTASNSYWFQAEGVAILGERVNQTLDILPSVITTWEHWRTTHPDTLVLARPTSGQYHIDPFEAYTDYLNNGQNFFPISATILADRRLNPGVHVLTVTVSGESVAFPLEDLAPSATTTTIGDREIVVLADDEGNTGVAYFTELDNGSVVDLVYEDDVWVDTVTNSTFDISGRAISGNHEGQTLSPVTSRFLLWFSALATTPNIAVYGQ